VCFYVEFVISKSLAVKIGLAKVSEKSKEGEATTEREASRITVIEQSGTSMREASRITVVEQSSSPLFTSTDENVGSDSKERNIVAV